MHKIAALIGLFLSSQRLSSGFTTGATAADGAGFTLSVFSLLFLEAFREEEEEEGEEGIAGLGIACPGCIAGPGIAEIGIACPGCIAGPVIADIGIACPGCIAGAGIAGIACPCCVDGTGIAGLSMACSDCIAEPGIPDIGTGIACPGCIAGDSAPTTCIGAREDGATGGMELFNRPEGTALRDCVLSPAPGLNAAGHITGSAILCSVAG